MLAVGEKQAIKVPRYCSTDRRDPHDLGTDALHQSWDFKNQLLYAFPPSSLITLVLGRIYHLSSQIMFVTPMVAESTVAARADQIIGAITFLVAGDTGHDIEPANEQDVDRLPQVTHDGMAYLSSTLRDGGVEPELAGFRPYLKCMETIHQTTIRCRLETIVSFVWQKGL